LARCSKFRAALGALGSVAVVVIAATPAMASSPRSHAQGASVSRVLSPPGWAVAATSILSGNFYQIENVNSGKCMEVYHSGTANLDNVDQYTCAWDPNKEWIFNFIKTQAGHFFWQLKNLGSGLCAEVYHSSSANLANVDQYTCNSTHPNQQWVEFDGVGADAGQVGFVNGTYPYRALEVYHSLKTNLANIDQYGPNVLSNGINFTPNQEWYLNSPL
jgi:Ricin-type beta-trefoil lectin domain-like